MALHLAYKKDNEEFHEDALKADALNAEAWELNRKDPRKAMQMSEEALQKSTAINYKNGMAGALKTIGACYIWLANYEEALTKSYESLSLFKELEDKKEEAQVHYNIGTNFYYTSDYDNSLKHYMSSYRLSEEAGNKQGQADGLNGIGTVYYTIDDNKKALEHLQKSLKLCEEIGDNVVKQKVLDGMGVSYSNLGQYDRALASQQECLALIKTHNGAAQVEAFALDGIGNTYAQLGDYDKAFEYYEQSLKIRREIGFRHGEAATLTNIGNLFFKKGEQKKSLEYLLRASQLAKAINSKEWLYKSEEIIARVYESMADLHNAYLHFKEYHLAKEEVRNEKADRRSRSLELQFKIEQAEAEKELLHDKNKELESYFHDVTILSDLGKEITSTLSVEKINETVYAHVNQLMDAAGFGIGVFSETSDGLVFPGYIEKGKQLPPVVYSLDDTNRLAVFCLTNKKEVFINNYIEDSLKYVPTITPPLVGEQPQSIMYLPLISKDKLVGVITVQSFKKDAFTDYHLNILRNLAVYAAIAIENAKLYEGVESVVKMKTQEVVMQKEEIERTYNNTRLLSEIGQQLTSTLDFETIFRKLYENVNQLMDAGCFGVRIYHPEQKTVEYKYEIENGEKLEPMQVSMDDDDNYSVWCIKNQKEIFINDNLTEYKKYTNRIRVVTGDLPHSLIFYPMTIGDRVIGVITVQSFKKNAYTKYHLDILKTLASYSAIALENASLYENLEEKVKARTREVIMQKEIIVEKNKEITDSINYALQIQRAILPHEKDIRTALNDLFILYQPKDVVSGDFYWFKEQNGKIFIAAADCTGHGVPGAFMSVLCGNQLDYAMSENKIFSPSGILFNLNNSIKATLKQNEQASLTRDGMDIALCAVDLQKMSLEFAGANRPMFYIRDGKLKEIPPTKFAIGGTTPVNQKFESTSLELKKGDCIYLCTDGFADQFGGKGGKKLMTKRLKEILTECSSKEMKEQRQIILDTFNSWKGTVEQVDDVLVMGFRV